MFADPEGEYLSADVGRSQRSFRASSERRAEIESRITRNLEGMHACMNRHCTCFM